MQNKSPLKHVIFLGAGASKSSGYPLARDLRLRLSSEQQMLLDLASFGIHHTNVSATIRSCFSDFTESVVLFRHGAFGSVDEFSKLASVKYPKHVQVMKRLTRLGLSLHNPEDTFHESDYYSFVQNLFYSEELHLLKRHITVISYNYDCYLDYLLLTAQSRRNHLAESPEPDVAHKNRLTSGFFKMDAPFSLVSLSELINPHFRHFKLHGSMAYADPHLHNQLFKLGIEERFKVFDLHEFRVSTTPIVFPWELFNEDGERVKAQHFAFKKDATNAYQHDEANKLYNLYDAIWRGAREAVHQAQKISFVGLSMHPYLKQGWRFLFDGKEGAVEVVVADKANEHFRNSQNRLHPASICGRVGDVLREMAPKMKCVKSSSEWDGEFKMEDFDKEADYDITPRYSFGEFIEREMDWLRLSALSTYDVTAHSQGSVLGTTYLLDSEDRPE